MSLTGAGGGGGSGSRPARGGRAFCAGFAVVPETSTIGAGRCLYSSQPRSLTLKSYNPGLRVYRVARISPPRSKTICDLARRSSDCTEPLGVEYGAPFTVKLIGNPLESWFRIVTVIMMGA